MFIAHYLYLCSKDDVMTETRHTPSLMYTELVKLVMSASQSAGLAAAELASLPDACA